jgi:hypothetical protein
VVSGPLAVTWASAFRKNHPLLSSVPQQVARNFWVDPRNRVSYQINAQAPQYDLHSLDDLRNLLILGSTSGQAQIVANVASISRATTQWPSLVRF